ncbi:low temperature requirement protein A [Plantactinospora sp. B5E13]|uniref:low temperature requirement protein A n=1 Tax=Plantactinospora sp. B5E13 TaxID=3153758 RepID=UPI00325E062D
MAKERRPERPESERLGDERSDPARSGGERLGSERLLRRQAHSRQASFLELFFDLAFIVSFALLSRRLVDDLDWWNAGQTAILLAAMWWIWIATAWSTDWYNPQHPRIRVLVLGAMFVGLLAAAAIPEAYGPHGLLFAGAYVGIHFGRAVLLLSVREHPIRRRSVLVAVWFGFSGILWLLGGFLTGPVRLALWLVAILIDYFIPTQGWRVPGLGRLPAAQLRVVGEHLSERYRQIFIVALGEVILVGGLTYTREGLGLLRVVALTVVFVNAGLLLWLYFVPSSGRLGGAIERNQARGGVYAAYCHAIMVAGAVLTAVGAELMIMHPLGEVRISWSMAIIGGAVLFLVGRILLALLVYAHPPWRGSGALVLLLAGAPGLVRLPPLAVGLVVDAVLLALTLLLVLSPGPYVRQLEAEQRAAEEGRS